MRLEPIYVSQRNLGTPIAPVLSHPLARRKENCAPTDPEELWGMIQDSVQEVVTSRYWLRRQLAPGGLTTRDPGYTAPDRIMQFLRGYDVIVNDRTCRWTARWGHRGAVRPRAGDWRCSNSGQIYLYIYQTLTVGKTFLLFIMTKLLRIWC